MVTVELETDICGKRESIKLEPGQFECWTWSFDGSDGCRSFFMVKCTGTGMNLVEKLPEKIAGGDKFFLRVFRGSKEGEGISLASCKESFSVKVFKS